MSAGSCCSNLYETRKNLRSLQRMAAQSTQVQILRDNNWQLLPSEELVPGDLVKIVEQKVPCDMIVLQGQIIVDESSLNGESCPIVKDCIPNTDQIYKADIHKHHTLFEGTQIIQKRGESIGLVLRTGFSTSKGKLIKRIMFPKPNNFKFYEDSFKFVGLLFAFSLIGFIVVCRISIEQGVETKDVITRSLDLITITVPPALPMAMTFGTAFAIARLKSKLITCISPPKVNVAGKIDLFVFDKTGTLTQEGMTILGVRLVNEHSQFKEKTQSIKEINEQMNQLDFKQEKDSYKTNTLFKFTECLACAHSLNYVKGILIGDQLELQMFQATGWQYQTSNSSDVKATIIPVINGQEIQDKTQILRIFHFNSKLKRMAVITQNSKDKGQYNFFQKGALESVVSNCIQSSIPEDLYNVHNSYTQAGYRVLALAYKQMQNCPDIQSVQLEEIEQSLTFLGLIIFQNALKPETFQEIQILHQAQIKTVVATGDDIYTTISIARECLIIPPQNEVKIYELNQNGLIVWKSNKNEQVANDQKRSKALESNPFTSYIQMEQDEENITEASQLLNYKPINEHQNQVSYAITGNAFEKLTKLAEVDNSQRIVLDLIIQQGQIFARMEPEHKSLLVEQLQKKKKLVGMCGDGANDCGALKQADVGISLSQAEASIASPFTSKIQNISSATIVLKEGRCALTTSFECFKYMALYSMIQFTSVACLYSIVSSLGDKQFL